MVLMFCPECGTLAFPCPGGVKCPNYKCGYQGVATNIVELMDGRVIDTYREMNSHSPAPCLPRRGPVPVIDPHQVIENVVNRVVFEDLREMHSGCEIWAMTMHDVYNYG